MSLNRLLAGLGLIFIFGCSSAPKAPAPAPAAAPAATAPMAPAADMKEMKAAPAAKAGKGTKKAKMANSADGAAAPAGAVTCESAGDKRVIEAKANGEGCEVMYTKMDKAESVAKSHNDASYCAKTVAKIREHLEKAGFTCK